jgi:hypothetical protein
MDIRHLETVTDLDLNRIPNEVPNFPSFADIKIVCKKKVDCRDVLVRKFGEERYNAMLQMQQPVMLSSVWNLRIIIFVLYT